MKKKKNTVYIIASIIILIIVIAFYTTTPKIRQSVTTSEIAPPIEGLTTQESQKKYIDYAYYSLKETLDKKPVKEPEISEIQDYYKLYITIINDNKIRCRKTGKANKDLSVKEDIKSAIERCIADERFGGTLKEEEIENSEIIYRILYNKKRIQGDIRQLQEQIELGIHAIEIVNNGNTAHLKESEPIIKRYDHKETLEEVCKDANLNPNCYQDPNTEIYIYDTLVFKGSKNKETEILYRHSPIVEFEEINNQLLIERIKFSKNWFLNNINEETGILEYKYFPSTDYYSTDNNHVRQLGALWSMTELKIFLETKEIDEIITHTLNYYLEFSECQETYCYLTIDGNSKLAYNAFLVFSLVNYQEYKDSEKLSKMFADGIVSQQIDDGSYRTYFFSEKNSGTDYYPGEAMLALMKIYEKTHDTKYLKSVEKAFPHYRTYWRNNKNTAFIPWHTQAYLILYQESEDEKLKEELASFVFEMNDWIIDNHQIQDDVYQDRIGGFPKKSPKCSTASYMESINDAYVLAQKAKDKKHEEKYQESITKATRFILQTQYTPENTFYTEVPERAIGGFKQSLTNNYIRNDFTQHAVSMMIKSHENNVFE